MIVAVFWLSVLLVGYAYAGYPALAAFLSATRGLDVLNSSSGMKRPTMEGHVIGKAAYVGRFHNVP